MPLFDRFTQKKYLGERCRNAYHKTSTLIGKGWSVRKETNETNGFVSLVFFSTFMATPPIPSTASSDSPIRAVSSRPMNFLSNYHQASLVSPYLLVHYAHLFPSLFSTLCSSLCT